MRSCVHIRVRVGGGDSVYVFHIAKLGQTTSLERGGGVVRRERERG